MKPMKIWIVRSKSGTNEPIWIYGNFIGYIFQDLFPDVTFENSPRQIEFNYVMN